MPHLTPAEIIRLGIEQGHSADVIVASLEAAGWKIEEADKSRPRSKFLLIAMPALTAIIFAAVAIFASAAGYQRPAPFLTDVPTIKLAR